MKRALASLLRRWATWLDPPAVVVFTAPSSAGVDLEMAAAQRVLARIYLRQALRRYSPQDQPAEA